MSGEALHKNSGAAPDRHSCGFQEKEEERRLRVCVVGVGEAVRVNRANSLNTGWVKVPVEFPASQSPTN